ncbi:hypothetical protein GCM10010510_29500 [Streptomyces anandii JCM 4720]|nr:hypothetical protein GCM10010510_29500 [Streptomyces anandii JCM 4720]
MRLRNHGSEDVRYDPYRTRLAHSTATRPSRTSGTATDEPATLFAAPARLTAEPDPPPLAGTASASTSTSASVSEPDADAHDVTIAWAGGPAVRFRFTGAGVSPAPRPPWASG